MENATQYTQLSGLLTPEHMAHVEAIMAKASFEDGKNTATASAREVKNNLQMNNQTQEYQQIQQVIMHALNQHTLFRQVTFPKNVYPFLISRYMPGMHYGWHVDSPLMGNMMRTDIAMTIFLNDPEEYDGGELELKSSHGIMQFKLKKGDAICYPCTQVHQVAEVTRGERKVAVTWIESLIRDAGQRTILQDLYQVQQSMLEKDPQSPTGALLMQTHSNLMRMWAG